LLERTVAATTAALRRAALRALEHVLDRAAAVLVTLPFDPEGAEAYAAVAPLRERLLGWRFTETAFGVEASARPAGLRAIEQGLFGGGRPPRDEAEGLVVLGAPRGEGSGQVLADRVRGLLAAGEEPEEILVLFRRWDEPAAQALRTLHAWGLPAAAAAPGRPLATEPAVAALVRAMTVPVEHWDCDRLVRLLRNGLVRPAWPEARPAGTLALAATALRETRVFRGRDALRDALARLGTAEAESGPGGDERSRRRGLRAERARAALRVFDRLAAAIPAVDRPGRWVDQVGRLLGLAAELGLGAADALEHLAGALDDHGAVLDGLGLAERAWSWAEFAREVEALVREVTLPASPVPPGSVLLATVDEADGLRARHVLLADLAEGTFPAREAVLADAAGESEEDPAAPGAPPAPSAYAREVLRFLRVVGAAERTLTLAHPTTDEKGQALLPAGFLEDVRDLFAPGVLEGRGTEIRRLDPALLHGPCGSPAEVRVRAVARAVLDDDPREVHGLARSPAHREALQGTAAALRVSHLRGIRAAFGPYDGRLRDPRAARRIAADFGPGHPFSPSQLESLAFCPFQFFLRYVLHLEPADELAELDDDRTARGSQIHGVLETLHAALNAQPADEGRAPAGRVAEGIEAVILAALERRREPSSEVERGLRQIDADRLLRAGRRYAQQFARYCDGPGRDAECHRFEVVFGDPARDDGHPALDLGPAAGAVRLQGMIDRIDLIRHPERTLFRVIDYKSGHCPGKSALKAGLALQLPLYALAVERIILAEQAAAPLDVGYWALAADGYKPLRAMAKLQDGTPVPLDTWDADRRELERYVLALVAQLRRGACPVQPRRDDCTKSCDYRTVCRIAQVRSVGKTWPDAPRLEPVS
ncbi:MAG TPA: PD-(D/E)XK nuclease family protein, partial [Isosphaeraceae bacterium]